MNSKNARCLVGVFACWLAACATPPQTRALLANPENILPRHIELESVPYFSQDDYQCGPATLAMALQSAGTEVAPETLKPELYLPQRRGSLQIEMLAVARRHGAIAYQLAPVLKNLLIETAAGTPVVVLQNLAYGWYPVWHYAIVIGYDLDRAEVMLRSGPERRQALEMRTFEYTWARGNYWAMVVMPPGRIPVTAIEGDFVGAISASERSGSPEHIQVSYTAALERWPGNLIAQIGIGNTAYQLHDFNKAEQAFRTAASDHPQSVAALNNLAQTLADQNRYREAMQIAQRAISLGGPLSDTVSETMRDIERKMPGK
ncbi:MAG: PA2778 family cysteine peptidase [Gallionella sp.]